MSEYVAWEFLTQEYVAFNTELTFHVGRDKINMVDWKTCWKSGMKGSL